MASKAGKKRVNPPIEPAEEGPSDTGAWRPQVESEHEFNPFANTTVAGGGSAQIGESAWESAPAPESSVPSATAGTSGKRRPGRKVARSAKKAAGSRKRAAGSRLNKSRGKGKVAARTRGAKVARRSAGRRKAKRR